MIRPINSLLLLFLVGGCFAPEKPSLTSDDPSLKIPAIRHSAATHDERSIHELVKDLDNDDPAVRFYAIRGLQEITGKSFDYRYYDDEPDREPAVKRWHEWLKQREATAQPAPSAR
jgi:hypothetical protein